MEVFPSVSELLSSRLQCSECSQEFSNSSARRLHEVKRHGCVKSPSDARLVEPHSSSSPAWPSPRRFHCPKPSCTKHFTALRFLKQHFLKAHTVKDKTCDCGKMFSLQRDLDYHRKWRCAVSRSERQAAGGPPPARRTTDRARKSACKCKVEEKNAVAPDSSATQSTSANLSFEQRPNAAIIKNGSSSIVLLHTTDVCALVASLLGGEVNLSALPPSSSSPSNHGNSCENPLDTPPVKGIVNQMTDTSFPIYSMPATDRNDYAEAASQTEEAYRNQMRFLQQHDSMCQTMEMVVMGEGGPASQEFSSIPNGDAFSIRHMERNLDDGLDDEFRDIETQTLPLWDGADMHSYWN